MYYIYQALDNGMSKLIHQTTSKAEAKTVVSQVQNSYALTEEQLQTYEQRLNQQGVGQRMQPGKFRMHTIGTNGVRR